MSTGRLSHVPGPNTSLSDDDASNWNGDNDLENLLNEANTFNATIIEFDFTAVASQISFRYLFASEEYQQDNSNTCQYSDLFGFLIRPASFSSYTNIALVPNTQTPVKVTTVHPAIPTGCSAQNEAYFGSWNGSTSPINFNGQTTILTATADVVPNTAYHVKLVIADEENYRYDSAVFLEAGSFQLSTDLGPDRLLATNNAICENDSYVLDASQSGNNTYKWFKDNNEIIGETGATYELFDAGAYNVEVTLDNNCDSYGKIVVEYSPNPTASDAVLVECDLNQDGITNYNLFDVEQNITNNDASLELINFYLSATEAVNDNNPIQNPTNFQNSSPNQIVYARIENQNGCFSIANLELQIATNVVVIPDVNACDGEVVDGFAEFNLNDIWASIQNQIPSDAVIYYFETETDAFNQTNELDPSYTNTILYSQTIYVKIQSNNQCYAISIVTLNVLFTPSLSEDESVIYCLNSYPDTFTLDTGLLNDDPNNNTFEWFYNGTPTSVNAHYYDVNEVGNYTVIVTNLNGCSASRTITVIPSNLATIETVDVIEASSNNTIIIHVSGDGDYLYTLDHINGFYQEENAFTNVLPGFHTVYVRDINGCGITEQLISVLGFPKYFTPNGDGFNDRWKVYGVDVNFNTDIDVKIFDRFGKLLKEQNNLSPGWDGTFNGYMLPSDDYWFLITFEDGRTYRGHFALVR